jgi:microcystin degradation protein MlrC
MGPSAVVRYRGVQIVLVSVREQPFDTAFAHTLGLIPEDLRYIGVKSQAHFRSGFEPWAGAIYVVREPSVHNPRSGSLAYTNVRPEVRTSLWDH